MYEVAKTILPLTVTINIHVASPQNNFEVYDSLHYRILHYSTGIIVKSTLSSLFIYPLDVLSFRTVFALSLKIHLWEVIRKSEYPENLQNINHRK